MENLSDNELLLLKWIVSKTDKKWHRLSMFYKTSVVTNKQAKKAMVRLSYAKLLEWHQWFGFYVVATDKGREYLASLA